VICCIDCETTGLTPFYHEAVDICILPLTDTFDPATHVDPFYVEIKPEFPDRVEHAALRANGHTIEELMARTITREIAVNMFTEWYNRTIPRGQKIEPLAQNWTFDRGFLVAAFKGLNLNNYLFYRARDTQRVIEYLNDRSRIHGVYPPFESSALSKVASQLGLDTSRAHSAMGDCLLCSAVYRTLCVK
jgi:DNA polymerase III epsilon subunit-like protein